MHEQGARGIRFNFAPAGATTPEMIEPLSKRVNELGWHIQINAPAAKIIEIMPILDRVPSPMVFDHLAHIPEPEGVNHPLFAQVRGLIDKGKTWVKLSGAYADSTAVAQAYAKASPERCVWGSDWPHPGERKKKPDDALLFDCDRIESLPQNYRKSDALTGRAGDPERAASALAFRRRLWHRRRFCGPRLLTDTVGEGDHAVLAFSFRCAGPHYNRGGLHHHPGGTDLVVAPEGSAAREPRDSFMIRYPLLFLAGTALFLHEG